LSKFAFENQEIILVDNLSNDGTIEMIQRDFPLVKLILPKENLGFSLGNNEGLIHCSGDYILLLNPDTEVYENSLNVIVNQLQMNPMDLIAPRLINPDGSLQYSYWKKPLVLDSFLELFFLNTIIKRNQYSIQPITNFIIDSASGAALAFSRKSYEVIGGLDPMLFWMEDSDLCKRYRMSRRSVIYVPDAVIMHIGGESSKNNYNKAISNQLLSKLKYFKKYNNGINFYFLVIVITFHVISRIMIFHILFLFNKTPKAEAYRFSLKKLAKYLLKNDLSV
jgi:GT2 family glycosyltransferase